MPSENYGMTVAERCVRLMGEVAVGFSGVPEECRRVLATATYLATSAVFSEYVLKGEKE